MKSYLLNSGEIIRTDSPESITGIHCEISNIGKYFSDDSEFFRIVDDSYSFDNTGYDEKVIAKSDDSIQNKKLEELKHTDSEFIRVIEDVIDVLITKNIIAITDLPQAAQDKISDRKTKRSNL